MNTTPMRKHLILLVAALLLVGAGCAPAARIEKATRDMMPKDLPVMEGFAVRDEAAWHVVTLDKGKRRLESRWQTDAQFDKVVAWYVDWFKNAHLATHTIENAEGVRIFWGSAQQAYYADTKTNASIFVHKAQTDGKTAVDMDVDLP